jgi:DNA polymerase elongation subunit (family B)
MKFYTSVNRYGNDILYRGYNYGRQETYRVKHSPTLYLPSKEKTQLKSIFGHNLKKQRFDTMRSASDFVRRYQDVEDFPIFGTTNYLHEFITQKFPNDIEFNISDINVVNFDIEVASDDGFPTPEEAAYPIISIAVKSSKSDIYQVWGLSDYDAEKTVLDRLKGKINYVKCMTEQDLIGKFLMYWNKNMPDILTGWNITFFDIPYLINRIRNTISDKAIRELSPWKLVKAETSFQMNKELQTYDIVGIQQADYLDLFQKFGYGIFGRLESYRLDHVGHVVLDERKLSYEEFGNLYTLYKEDHQMFIDYNIKDVELVDRLDQRLNLISLCLTIAYKGGVNIENAFGTTAIWESILYRRMLSKNTISPVNRIKKVDYNIVGNPGTETKKIAGGYVKEPQVGEHKWVVSFDLNSLYPNIIVQQNISPETIAEPRFPQSIKHYLDCDRSKPISDKYAVCSSGVAFDKKQLGIVPELIVDYYSERSEIKKEMLNTQSEYERTKEKELQYEINKLHNSQYTIKILLNSLYGAMGNQYFKYFDNALAESVTLTGQTVIQWAEKAINENMNNMLKTDKDYVIAIDTDSVYINMEPFVSKFNPPNPVEFLDKISQEHFEPLLKKSFDEFYYVMNGYQPRMEMAREVIADKGIWTAKKRYILNVHNSEGVQYTEPKLKMMGIEAIKSSTPEVVRDKFKEVFKLLMTGTESDVQKFIADFKEEFSNMGPEQVSFPRSVQNITKWKDNRTIYMKSTPIHVRGALLYNHHIKEKGLDKKYEMIKDGEKIKFCYLKLPNHIKENIITFPNHLPKELDLHKYIDYNTQYDKVFVEPLKLILDAIGWKTEAVSTLEDFFT